MARGWIRRCRKIAALLFLALTLPGIASAQPAKPATGSHALECAAITFRGLTTSAVQDGVQEAGLYKSPLGRIGLEARIRAHRPVDYWLTLDGQGVTPIDTLLPAALEPCLKAKGDVVRLAQQRQPCLGNRFKIVLTRAGTGAAQYLLLYSLIGSGGVSAQSWRFCRATIIPKTSPS
jgi:hypothetical protein